MIDAEIQNGQITKRYIFINLRPVAVIEYENDSANDDKKNSTSGSKYADYSPNRYIKTPNLYHLVIILA